MAIQDVLDNSVTPTKEVIIYLLHSMLGLRLALAVCWNSVSDNIGD